MQLNALMDLEIESAEELKHILEKEDFQILGLAGKEQMLQEVARGYADIIFLSGSCGRYDEDLIATVKHIKELDPRVEIILIGSAEYSVHAVEVIKHGATACVSARFDSGIIRDMITEIKENAHHRKEVYQFETALHDKYTFENMISRNPAMLDIFSLIRRVAPYFRSMLVTGDTGTGKEVIARALHNVSPVASEPFIVCNCSGLVEHLIESELFGHVKGAFTGAIADKTGLFKAAGRGTLFLDEIGDMPVSFQPHLLRVLQNGEFRRVGSTETMKAECRVIAATNANLHEKIRSGLFREDLYFRLAVITIELPSLMDRKEDISLLSRFFLQNFRERLGKEVAGISMPAQRCLMSYHWPGNIRELENVIERAVLMTSTTFIRSHDLPAHILNVKKEDAENLTLDELIRGHITGVLRSTGGNKTHAASILGISRRALQRKIEKYRLS